MSPDNFRKIEDQIAASHKGMADELGMAEVSVKRFATGAAPIPGPVARLSVALLLIQKEGLGAKFRRLMAKLDTNE
jgi:hypothetical protein